MNNNISLIHNKLVYSFIICFIALFTLTISLFSIGLLTKNLIDSTTVIVIVVCMLLVFTVLAYIKKQSLFHLLFFLYAIGFTSSIVYSYNYEINYILIIFLSIQLLFIYEILSQNLIIHFERCIKFLSIT